MRTREANITMIDFLLERGADPNCCGIEGHTPLMCAAAYGNAQAIELLLDAGADVNACDRCYGRCCPWDGSARFD
jgi:ankyrin repeat protein